MMYLFLYFSAFPFYQCVYLYIHQKGRILVVFNFKGIRTPYKKPIIQYYYLVYCRLEHSILFPVHGGYAQLLRPQQFFQILSE